MIQLIVYLGLIYTIIVPILYKSYSLPDGEIPRGTEHAINAVPVTCSYYELLDKFNTMVHNNVSGTYENSMRLINTHISKIIISGQRIIKGTLDTPRQQDDFYITPKLNINYQESTIRLPKERNFYGNGGLILGNRFRIQSITKVIQFKRSLITLAGNTGKSELKKLDVENGKYFNLYKKICSIEFLELAYIRLKSKPGNMTPGIDNKTLDGINLNFISDLMNSLKDESFKFTSVKRVYIPKNNGKMRPLGIPTIKDKLVQETMRIILELIYEEKFSNLSHGFRPKRSCHTALKEISKWNGLTWVIEGDIKGFFDNVDHKILESILKKSIIDQQFIDLYWKLVRSGYVDNGIKYETLQGVPLGGIISPILSNIYLNEFDNYVEEFIDELSSKNYLISKVNPAIVKYSDKLTKLNTEYQMNKCKNILRQIKKLRLERNKLPSRIRTDVRLRYVRYADDWIIGVIGSKELAISIKEKCKLFLRDNLKIELNDDKTKITHIISKSAKFLGVELKRNMSKNPKIVNRNYGSKVIKARINQTRIYFYIPVKELINKLTDSGFIKTYISKNSNKKLVPNAVTKWIFLDHRSIITRYNAVIMGLVNYYKLTDNFHSFHTIINYFIHHSCAKTLARKFNLKTRASVFKKFGRYLSAPAISKLKPLKILTLNSYKKNTNILTKYKINTYNPFEVLNWNLRTQIGYPYESCWICQSDKDIEMHHVKHLRKDGN